MKTIRINKDKPNFMDLYDCTKCDKITIGKSDNYCGKCGSKIRWVKNRD